MSGKGLLDAIDCNGLLHGINLTRGLKGSANISWVSSRNGNKTICSGYEVGFGLACLLGLLSCCFLCLSNNFVSDNSITSGSGADGLGLLSINLLLASICDHGVDGILDTVGYNRLLLNGVLGTVSDIAHAVALTDNNLLGLLLTSNRSCDVRSADLVHGLGDRII